MPRETLPSADTACAPSGETFGCFLQRRESPSYTRSECGAVSGCGQDGAVTTVPMYPSPPHKKPFSFTCRCPGSLPDAPLVLGFCRFLGIFHVDEPIICSQGWFCFFSDDLSVFSRCVPLAGPCRAGRWSTGRERGGPAAPGREATGLPRLVWPVGCCGRCSPNRGERPPLLVL